MKEDRTIKVIWEAKTRKIRGDEGYGEDGTRKLPIYEIEKDSAAKIEAIKRNKSRPIFASNMR